MVPQEFRNGLERACGKEAQGAEGWRVASHYGSLSGSRVVNVSTVSDGMKTR